MLLQRNRKCYLCQAVSGDTQYLSPAGHKVCQKHDMALINGHAVGLHGRVDLGHDSLTSRLYAQRVGNLSLKNI